MTYYFADIFVAMLLMILGLSLLVLGIFAAYFGSGKVRTFGVILGVVGIVVWLITLFARGYILSGAGVSLGSVVYNGVLYLVSAIVGAVIALLIFLAVLLKT